MKKSLLASGAAAFLLLSPVAYGQQSLAEKSGANSTLGIAPTTKDFAAEVANSDMFEIESSKLAQANGDAKIKPFADKMIADHTATSSELKSIAGGGKINVSLPTALDKSHQSKLDKLKGLKGEDFVREYESEQVSAHKDAVSLFERYSKGGDNASLKAFASKTLPKLQEHLTMAQNLQK